jgi:ABC transporter
VLLTNIKFAGYAEGTEFRSSMLKKIVLLRERVEDWTAYPFSVPTIASLPEISIHSRIVFFAGENGTGKSTLLEAIAAHYGFGPEGGNRNIQNDTTEHNHSRHPRASIASLIRQAHRCRLLPSSRKLLQYRHTDRQAGRPDRERGDRTPNPSKLWRPEPPHQISWRNFLHAPRSQIPAQRPLPPRRTRSRPLPAAPAIVPPPHPRHPAPLQRRQFFISTHSPVLLGYPGAQIFSFDDGHLHEIDYEDTAPLQIVRRFTTDRDNFLQELFQENPSLFEEPDKQ